MLFEAQAAFASPLVDTSLYEAKLGGPPSDLDTLARYLRLPLADRPLLTPWLHLGYYRATRGLPPEADAQLDWLRHGVAAGQAPHPLIDPGFMRAQHPAFFVGREPAEALAAALDAGEVDPCAYVSLPFCRTGRDAPGLGLRALLEDGFAGGTAPHPLIDPAWYASRYDDVPRPTLAALLHFVLIGDAEGRSPSPRFDGAAYLRRNPDVAALRAPALWHFLTCGGGEQRHRPNAAPAAAPPEPGEPRLEAATLVARYQAARATIAAAMERAAAFVPEPPPCVRVERLPGALRSLAFEASAQPEVSVLIPTHDQALRTAECLLSLPRGAAGLRLQVVLVDDGSADPRMRHLRAVPGLTVLRHERPLGYLLACNAGYKLCRAPAVLLLNNDAQLLPDALRHLLACLDADETIAAAAPKLLFPSGVLQEAGCTLSADGTSRMVGFGQDPSLPGWSHDRDVAYASAACLLVRRSAVGAQLFDPDFAPGYCEDAALCLRLAAAGARVRYVAAAVCVHHLGQSVAAGGETAKRQLVARNTQRLQERFGEALAAGHAVRAVAFYLPQFHPTPENDAFWGRGFTEWRNVAAARPGYAGHYQPHVPGELGFYDLRLPSVFAEQASLARRYGLAGFCVYLYHLAGRRVLGDAFEAMLRDPAIDFPFCLCWANENWTRRWDGGAGDVLLAQDYTPATLQAVLDDAVRLGQDPRHLRVRRRPIFLVYRPLLLPDPAAFAAAARAAYRRAGLEGVHLVYVESMETVDAGLDPGAIGFDAAVEFPPHGLGVPAPALPDERRAAGWDGQRYDYPATAAAFASRSSVGWTRYPAVFPGWDSTPRHPRDGTVFEGASPEVFQAFVEARVAAARDSLLGEERLIFVNAWNEWAEGAHLEPDLRHGHRWLEALHNALRAE